MNNFLEQSVQTILQLSLHASGIVVCVVIIQWLLSDKLTARWRYALWAIVVARLLLPWNYEAAVLAPKPLAMEISESVNYPLQEAGPLEQEEYIPLNAEPVFQAELVQHNQSEVAPVPISASMVEDTEKSSLSLWVGLGAIWLFGAFALPMVILIQHIRLSRQALLYSSTPPEWVLDTLESCRKEFGFVAWPTIHMCDQVHTPTLMGAIRPKILLPSSLVEKSSPEDMRLFLLHEMTHLRSGDIWFSWLWCIAFSLHWFNPVMWWVGTRIHKDRELACDESVLRSIGEEAKDEYAHALLHAIENLSEQQSKSFRFGLAGIAEDQSEIARRIESILAPIVRNKRIRVIGASLTMLVLCASFIYFVPSERTIQAEEQNVQNALNLEEMIQAIDEKMAVIKNSKVNRDAYKDKKTLDTIYIQSVKKGVYTPKELTNLQDRLSGYLRQHKDDQDYVWRILHLQAKVAKDIPFEGVGMTPWETLQEKALEHYPTKRYSMPSKHSKFQHLVNEMAMMIWDREGFDAAEKWILEKWETGPRFVYFYPHPWELRITEEKISVDRLVKLRNTMQNKSQISLRTVEIIVGLKGYLYNDKVYTEPKALREKLATIKEPSSHFIAMGITSEDISLKQFRESQKVLMTITKELGFDHFSDIGVQKVVREDFAWNHNGAYRPPNFVTFFPDDKEGGKALQALWQANDKDSRSDEEILSTVHQGLRNVQSNHMPILRWIGNKFIWNKSPQHPYAIEIMYHASDFSGDEQDFHEIRGSGVYFGLSVVDKKTMPILRTLVELSMAVDDPNDLHRVYWGAQSQREELLHYLIPFQESEDKVVRDKAEVCRKIFTGEIKAFEWAAEQARIRAHEQFDDELPSIKKILEEGRSEERMDIIRHVMRERIALIMDDTFVEAFAKCAEDPDKQVRYEVARIAGERWVWSAKPQNKEAIALMLTLAKDKEQYVRNAAVYFGLSTVKDKSDEVITEQLEIAFTDRDPNVYGRVAWGFKSARPQVAKMLQTYIDGQDETKAKQAREVYKDMVGQEYKEK